MDFTIFLKQALRAYYVFRANRKGIFSGLPTCGVQRACVILSDKCLGSARWC